MQRRSQESEGASVRAAAHRGGAADSPDWWQVCARRHKRAQQLAAVSHHGRQFAVAHCLPPAKPVSCNVIIQTVSLQSLVCGLLNAELGRMREQHCELNKVTVAAAYKPGTW